MEEKSILLVEDNQDDVELIIRTLRKQGVANKVVTVSDGQEALDWISGAGAHSGRDKKNLPAVVLLDLKLPKVDGFQVLERLRADERTELLPVVILTSSKEEIDRLNGYKLGANSFVCKPVNFEAFSEAVRQLGCYWLLLNEGPPEK